MKIIFLNLELLYEAKNIPLVLPSSPIQIWGKSGKGFVSYDRKPEQTKRAYTIHINYVDAFYANFHF